MLEDQNHRQWVLYPQKNDSSDGELQFIPK